MPAIKCLIATILLTAVTQALDMKITCNLGPSGCKYVLNSDVDFPGNKNELNNFCNMVIEYYTCLGDFMNQCIADDYPEEADRIWHIVHILLNVCDKDGGIYKGLVPNIGCIKVSLLNFNISCRKLSDEVLISVNEDTKEQDFLKAECLRRALEVACTAMKVGDLCGTSGEKAFVNAVKELKKESDFCGGHMFQEMIKLSQEIEMEEELRKRLLALLAE